MDGAREGRNDGRKELEFTIVYEINKLGYSFQHALVHLRAVSTITQSVCKRNIKLITHLNCMLWHAS